MSTIIQLSGLNGNWQISGDISGTNKCWIKDNYKLKYNSNGIGWVISDITNNIDLFTINTSGQISGNNYWNPIVWNQNLSQYPSQINKIHISGPKQQKQQYLNMPITLESLEDGNTITLTKAGSPAAITCYYKVNNGEWTLYNVGSTVIPPVNTGDKVSFKCDTTTFSSSSSNYYYFSPTKNIKVYGNIMSLVQGNRELTSLTAIENANQFRSLFYNCQNLINVYNLQLPATTLTNYCYSNMFRGCTQITSSPTLPATSLVTYCYSNMFRGCTNLNLVTVKFTNWVSNGTPDWLYGVASNGTFNCPTALGTQSTITRGTSYCPANWMVVNPSTPVITLAKSSDTISGTVNTAINNYQIEASVTEGATLGFNVKSGYSLPQGLSLNTINGIISGTPTASSSISIVIQVRAAEAQTKQFTAIFDIKQGSSPISDISDIIVSNGWISCFHPESGMGDDEQFGGNGTYTIVDATATGYNRKWVNQNCFIEWDGDSNSWCIIQKWDEDYYVQYYYSSQAQNPWNALWSANQPASYGIPPIVRASGTSINKAQIWFGVWGTYDYKTLTIQQGGSTVGIITSDGSNTCLINFGTTTFTLPAGYVANSFKYSIDNGSTWTTINSNSIELNVNGTIRFIATYQQW